MIPLRLAAAAALFAAGCAAGPRKSGAVSTVGGARPQWVDGESAEFPRMSHITGVGSADDESSAAERARGEVAKVFTVSVEATSTVSESESNSNSNGKQSHSYSNDVAQKVRTVTEKVLEGVDIVARWKDSSTGRYYALAVLPKDHALLAITEKASEIDSEVGQQKALFAQAADAFGRAKAAAKLLALSKARDGLNADSRVLGGGNLPGDFDSGSIRTQATQALAALNVIVAVTGEGADAAQTAVVSGLNSVGLSAKSGAAGDPSDLSASAQVKVERQSAGDPRWQRFRASAIVALSDGRTGKTFSTFDVSAREDATDSGEARRRALASLAKDVAAKVTAAINDFFANQ
jgi:hypothetical protein